MTRYLLAAALAALALGYATIRGWLQRRATARAEATAERLRAERDAATADRDRAQLQEAATRDHADRQAAGHVAAGEIPDATTGRPDADRAALYDGMRTAADRRRAGAGAGGDAAVRPVPGPDATGGDGRGH